jgi:hypothetical protein
MPALFPEVFSREHAGFDVLVGNPPWDKVEHDRQIFLARHLPGFKGVKDQAERDRRARRFFSDNPLRLEEFERESLARAELRQALVAGPYPGMGVDHPDLAKAFAWRNRQLLSLSGAFALVLPRMVLSGRALWDWRRTFPSEFSRTEMVLLANSSNWVFPNVHAQKEFVLVIASRKSVERGQFLGGPHRSIEIWGTSRHVLKHLDTKTLGELGEIPKIPTAAAADVLSKLFEAPRFSQSDFFMQSVYETDATKDKPKFKLKQTPAAGEIPVYKGESIDLWNSDTSKYYAVVEGGFISGILLERTRGLSRKKNSAFFGFDGGLRDLPMARARVAYRWSTNSTNRRTLIVALIPPNRVLTNGIPYLYMPSADLRKEAIVLGVFSSLVFDWLVRRYVEGTMRQGLLNALPFPEIDLKSKLSDRIVDVVTSLLSEDRRFDGWIAKLKGAKLDHLGVSSRASLLSRLDALVAISYGLKRDELIEILDTFHNGDGEHRERRTEILVQFDSETSK